MPLVILVAAARGRRSGTVDMHLIALHFAAWARVARSEVLGGKVGESEFGNVNGVP